ncbi:phosphoglycerate mutase [Planococcus antarcticus DSM 14505]|uniref:Histidine phosphatase family protein n=1 Tax=Planococcus antarcticus DSM 14505 TaxID=1185653 RepID=A0A1C7DEY1_9BACL|nr:histidine phosphatase family protein [Planococcus antarcticus]ANU09831.1 histidine phosphatase family protein [Planococcus antarcticus DSM 14505]EIM07565.1 phosphoglycerate mutase [Planococcus antarcticus DSM 14505]
MNKTIFLIRHCQATGQAPDAELTEMGKKQAKDLAEFLQKRQVIHFISSPLTRAIQSIEPAADCLGLPIRIDDRLAERVLSSEDLPDWMEKLEESFDDADLKFAGGESGKEATDRAMEILNEMEDRTAAVTHGNLLGLLLKQIDASYGFSEWQKLTNPDVYEVEIKSGDASVKRVWS